jgi:hypothetical protein
VGLRSSAAAGIPSPFQRFKPIYKTEHNIEAPAGDEKVWRYWDVTKFIRVLQTRVMLFSTAERFMSALIGTTFAVGALVGVIVLLTLVNVGNVVQQRPLETTAAAALLVTFALGILVGQGHVFAPTASAIVMALLLALKPQF